MAAKAKRDVSGSALLRRKKFMEGAAPPIEEPKAEEKPAAATETADSQSTETPDSTTAQAAPKPVREKAPTPPIADETQEEAEGLTKKQLQERYVAVKQDGLAADTIYFPHELYEAFREVWFARKKTKRGFKKSHIIIEALLRHPDVVAELQRRGLLK